MAMTHHKYDVVIVGAGGAGMRAALESATARPHRGPHQALPDALPHRRGAGRHVRRAGQRRGGQLGVAHLRHRQGRRLPRRPGRRRDHVPRRPSTRSSTSRRWACRSTARPRARSTSAASAATPATTARPPVRRSCYAADRTGHMILQTLYQNCVKHDVEFFNEFYVLDLLHDRRSTERSGRRRRLRAGHRRDPRLPGQGGHLRDRRLRQGLQDDVERAHPHRRRHGHRLAQGPAAGGHGVLPVPPDRPGRPRHPAVRGGARRGRHPAQHRRRALHGALRADHQGPRAARHRRPVDGQRGARGPRLRARTRTTSPRPDPPRARAHRREAPRHHRVRPHLPRRRALHRAGPGLSRPRTTRWAASRPTSRARCCANNDRRRPRPVRRRRGRLRVRARRQPARHQLAARHQRLRPPRRHRRRRVRADASTTSSCPTSPSRFVIDDDRVAARRRPARERIAAIRTRAAGDHGPQRPGLPHRGVAQAGARATSTTLKERYANVVGPGQGQALQHRPARGRRARLPARPRRGARRLARWPARSPAAATSARTTRPATT